MRTAVYIQDANDPDRRVLAGHCDLPRTLSPRAIANLPFARLGIEPGDVRRVELRTTGGRRACVILSAAPVTCLMTDQAHRAAPEPDFSPAREQGNQSHVTD